MRGTRTPWDCPRRQGMSLIELLTSVAVCVVLSTLATVVFLQVRGVLQRMHVRLDMHNSARFIHQQLSEQLAALQQDGAMWLESTKDDGSGNGQLTLTFLKGKMDEHDFTNSNGGMWNGETNGVYKTRCTDLTWSCWHWDQKHAVISSGTTSPPRQFRITTPWNGPNGNYQSAWMVNMPQPLQSATPYPQAVPAGSSQAALSGNRYGSPDLTNDISDYQDIQNHLALAIRNVTGFTVEMILNNGTVVDAGVSQSKTIALDGSYVNADASSPASNGVYPYKLRPRLIRVLLDMTDPVTGISQSFSFSFQPPCMLPLAYPTQGPIP